MPRKVSKATTSYKFSLEPSAPLYTPCGVEKQQNKTTTNRISRKRGVYTHPDSILDIWYPNNAKVVRSGFRPSKLLRFLHTPHRSQTQACIPVLRIVVQLQKVKDAREKRRKKMQKNTTTKTQAQSTNTQQTRLYREILVAVDVPVVVF